MTPKGSTVACSSKEELLHFARALQLKGGEKFGAPIHTAQFRWGRIGPTWQEARILKATLKANAIHFLHLVRAWDLVTLPSWFHWCTVQVVSGPWYLIHPHVMGHLSVLW